MQRWQPELLPKPRRVGIRGPVWRGEGAFQEGADSPRDFADNPPGGVALETGASSPPVWALDLAGLLMAVQEC